MAKGFVSNDQRKAAFARMGKDHHAMNPDIAHRAVNTLPDTPENRKIWAENSGRIDIEGLDTPIKKGKKTSQDKFTKEHETMYELQRYEPNPHGHREELTKNRTYQPMRWKGVAQSQDPLKLSPSSSKRDNYRIVDLDTLEVVKLCD